MTAVQRTDLESLATALLERVEEEEPRDADGNYRRDGVALDERGNRQESPRPHV